MAGEYYNTLRIQYDCKDGSFAQFVPACSKCGRFVKADESIWINESVGLKDQPNADCSKCGRTEMLFEGFF